MPPPGPTPTVLVVEDDDALREFYRSALIGAGFTAIAVRDGVDALQVIESRRVPAAVVLDLALPRLSGRDVGQELRASVRTRHVPIIVVTGTDAGDVQDMDVDCVLRKPVPPGRLIEAVSVCLRKTSAV